MLIDTKTGECRNIWELDNKKKNNSMTYKEDMNFEPICLYEASKVVASIPTEG